MDSAIQSDKCPPKQVFVLLIKKFILLVDYFDLNMLLHTEIRNLVYGV